VPQPPPAADLERASLVDFTGRYIVCRWAGVGWCRGRVTQRLNDPGRTACGYPANFEVQYADGLCDHALTTESYSASHNAKVMSWCLLRPA